MEFKQITITNFLSYFDENTVDFSDMTTVILGQNTSGKSKFFDAINWALFERVYNTDIYAWVTDKKEIIQLVPNKKCIKESFLSKKDEMETSVRLIITDGIKDIVILRTYYYTFDANGGAVLSSKGFSWREINELGEVEKEEYDDKAELRVLEKFPLEIRDFFLFQGEAASQILKLHKGSKFTTAVKKIARLENFEIAKNISEKFYTTSRNIIKKNATKSREIEEEQISLDLEIDKLKEKLIQLQNDYNKADESRAEYQANIDEANDYLSSQKDFEDLFAKKQKLENEQRSKIRTADTLKDEALEIADSWVFFKINDKLQSFGSFYKALEKKAHVPAPIQQNLIVQALQECKCPVCDTTFEKDSSTWKVVESKKTKNDTDSLAKELTQLHYCMTNVSSEIVNVPKAVQSYYERSTRVTEERKLLNDAIKSLKAEIDSIRVTETNQETKQKIQEAQQKLSINTRALKKAEDDFYMANARIKDTKQKIDELEAKSMKLATAASKDIPDEDKIQLYYSHQLAKAMEKLTNCANDLAFSEIQKTANEYYKEMTKENPSFVGELKINFEDSDIYFNGDSFFQNNSNNLNDSFHLLYDENKYSNGYFQNNNFLNSNSMNFSNNFNNKILLHEFFEHKKFDLVYLL